MALNGHQQITETIQIEAERASVWEVLSDSRLLPQWVPAVEEVTSCSLEGEAVGATRSCSANLAGRGGTMVERCVELIPMVRLAYVVDDESFGMRRMFDDYGFALNLADAGPRRTRVTIETHYTPRNPVYAAMNAAVIRRRFRRVAREILGGLESYCEAASRAAAG